MAIVFKDAVRTDTPLNIGLVGPSGCGKTLSALYLAAGIQQVRGGEIFGIDTEAKRMLHHADKGVKFKHGVLTSFASKDYAEAIVQAAKACNRGVVIVDSMSHEHEGIGGYLDFHDKEAARLGGNEGKSKDAVSWRAWAQPAAARRHLINTILQQDIALICCFRAKEKSIMVKNNGKTEIESIGWQAIAGDEFVYEQTIRLLLPPAAKGLPDWSDSAFRFGVAKADTALIKILNDGKKLCQAHGIALAQWAKGESAQPGKTEKAHETPKAGKATSTNEIDALKSSLREWYDMAKQVGRKEQFAAMIVSVCRKKMSELSTVEDFKKACTAAKELENEWR